MNTVEASNRLKNPKIAALMASIAGDDENKSDENDQVPHPPVLFEEFIKLEGIEGWPLKPPSEAILDFESLPIDLPSFDDLKTDLVEGAPFGFEIYDNLEKQLKEYDIRLSYFSSFLSSPRSLPSRIPDGLFHAPSKEFLDNAAMSDAVVLHQSRGGKKKDVKQALQEEAQEMKTRNIEYISFGGFRPAELSELPSQLEAPQLLNKVTEAQPFNRGICQLWKKLFLSPASVAILQDTFWWFFLENFQHNPAAQDRLFTRIADSYVALFFSVHSDVRDKFFKDYPRCLAQCVYLTFREAFPESAERFNEEFVTELSCLTSEWISGVKPPTGDWKKWPWDKLCAPPGGVVHVGFSNRDMSSKMRRTTMTTDSMKFDIEDYIPESSSTLPGDSTSVPVIVVFKEDDIISLKQTKTGTRVSSTKKSDKIKVTPPTKAIKARQQLSIGAQESAPSGPGPDLERVLFNLSGRSPLVAHHLYMKHLRDKEDAGKTMKRTEVLQEPPPSMTYKEIICQSQKTVKRLHEQRKKSEFEAHEDVLRLHHQHRLAMQKMNSSISLPADPMEVKVISDKLLDEAKEKGFFHRPDKDVDSIRSAENVYIKEDCKVSDCASINFTPDTGHF